MSQDLFAAFGETTHERTEPSQSTAGGFNSSSGLLHEPSAIPGQILSAITLEDEDDDDFGDFEDASKPELPSTSQLFAPDSTMPHRDPVPRKPTKQASTVPAKKKAPEVGSHPFAGHMDLLFGDDDADDEGEYNAGADEMTDLATNPEAAMAYSKRVIAEQQAEQERKKGPLIAPSVVPSRSAPEKPEGPKKLQKKSGYVPPRNVEVLFDADETPNEDSEEGWGDFEEPEQSTRTDLSSPRTKGPSAPADDLLGLNESIQPQSVAPKAQKLPMRDAKASPGVATLQQLSEQNVQDEDKWDDFEDAVPTPSTLKDSLSSTVQETPFGRSMSAIAGSRAVVPSADLLPPTNIPPPAVLLSMFPAIFASGDEALFAALAKLEFKQRQVLLAHPATHMFLRGYLSIAVVLGHIIAGRRLRWKRDQHLAQSMRIGPAAAGGKGGMKLAGVDKGEVAKEDREVLDAVRGWKTQVGKLRTAVTSASALTATGEPKLPAVPEIADQIPVKALKSGEGGVTAPHACALCGLKREERVSKVDLEVNDSFGEWWIEGMNMHVVCRSFWTEHKGKLRSR